MPRRHITVISPVLRTPNFSLKMANKFRWSGKRRAACRCSWTGAFAVARTCSRPWHWELQEYSSGGRCCSPWPWTARPACGRCCRCWATSWSSQWRSAAARR
ncbi:hypothetical protein EJB05_38267 [Eragrostis curvula]|uniref:Uncharacterized protein n=1 Tax=Eragrostis curvula TaxID=38414 RepID=A0A5J9TTU3_9POAL|nr:hypothetical protein EJB05_38267 [Eragrostis curvula]